MYYLLNGALHNRKKLRIDVALPKMIRGAMGCGCHFFDTSRAYGGSEYILGKTLKHYNRNEYVITTKVSNQYQYNDDVRGSLETSLSNLQMDYVDLYLLHWPVTNKYINSWKVLEELYDDGLCKAIGVCNCNIHHLETLEKNASLIPMVNQIECHPLLTQNALREYCSERNIRVMAYTSTARMDERLNKTILVPIAKKYNKSIAQIILRWHQQIGNIPIVNTSNLHHLKENYNISSFSLTDEEIQSITNININSRLRYDPDNCDFRQL